MTFDLPPGGDDNMELPKVPEHIKAKMRHPVEVIMDAGLSKEQAWRVYDVLRKQGMMVLDEKGAIAIGMTTLAAVGAPMPVAGQIASNVVGSIGEILRGEAGHYAEIAEERGLIPEGEREQTKKAVSQAALFYMVPGGTA